MINPLTEKSAMSAGPLTANWLKAGSVSNSPEELCLKTVSKLVSFSRIYSAQI
jgi:hypothetical protein